MEPGATCDSVIKFNQDRTLVWMEYPGIVKNTDKMIQTLGGTKNISAAYRDPKKRIDLRFRPDDPCCHPVCGDRTSAVALLLMVRKYKKKKKDGDAAAPDEFRYILEIVGTVKTSYRFNTLCDFQYLPLYNDVKNDTLVNMIPSLQVTGLDESVYEEDVPLFLPPPTFSRFDQSQDVLFRKDPKYKWRQNMPADKIGVTRPRRAHFAQYIKYEDIKAPKEALPVAVQSLAKFGDQEGTVLSVKKLFDERPIWSKNAIVCKLQCPLDHIKTILPAVAYYFITGPWRSLWVRFGYDPRKDPAAVKYQLLDFRLRQGLNTPNIPIKAKRSTLSYRLPNLMPRSRPLSHIEKDAQVAETTSRSHSESVYIFKSGFLPVYRQTFYQVCDIQHPKVAEMLQSYFEKTDPEQECNLKSGWLPEDMAAKIRDILSKDIQQTLAKKGNVQILDMQRDGRKKSHTRKVHWGLDKKDSSFHTRNEMVESMLGLGAPPESSEEEDNEESDVEDEEPAEILDSLMEEEVREGESRDIEEGTGTSSPKVSAGFGFEEDLDYDEEEITDFMEDFDAYFPDGLVDEFDDGDA